MTTITLELTDPVETLITHASHHSGMTLDEFLLNSAIDKATHIQSELQHIDTKQNQTFKSGFGMLKTSKKPVAVDFDVAEFAKDN